ncbi:complex I intermediate-associated protein 30-domain-containing protein [Papiliotrema laurentii]|uniref:Complex I intermediate-associated protein 30-domain-containing protein n=1 Tax=Papiliotrema laurentii TaxID=5418 RepID=A0AAD9L9Z7_PAPLA|nr:complex I intermediate-associated protein 30-domain-containing protein [Papiliotrema laurentii]
MTNLIPSVFPPWDFSRWTDVDDRVRGGSSVSHLEPVDIPSTDREKGKTAARFWGNLDIDTLGGAGFASQRYRFGPEPLRLPRLDYKGISLVVRPDQPDVVAPTGHSANTFTLVLKQNLSTRPPSRPKTPPQPDPASLSYEASFTPSRSVDNSQTITLDFEQFKPTYRGREVGKDDPKYEPLRPETIYELSLMCRSDFGGQKGKFSLIVEEIKGWKKEGKEGWFVAVVNTLGAVWTGLVVWVMGLFQGQGRIALRDEEKDPLV